MFGKKDEKLELLKDLLGTRAAYSEFVKNVDLSKEEKDIIVRASLEVNKKSPNQNIIDQAHAILIQKSFTSASEDEEQIADIPNETFEKSSSIGSKVKIDWMRIVKPLLIIITVVLLYKMFTIDSGISNNVVPSTSDENLLEVGQSKTIKYDGMKMVVKLNKNRKLMIQNIGRSLLWLDIYAVNSEGDTIKGDETSNIKPGQKYYKHVEKLYRIPGAVRIEFAKRDKVLFYIK